MADRMRELLLQLAPTVPARWSMVENLHITTKFIGNWPADKLDQLKAQLRFAHAPVPIAVRGLGFYSQRVFLAHVEKTPELVSLARTTEDALAEIGVKKEDRDYSPHLTLARNLRRKDLPALHDAAAHDFGSFEAHEFFLYESRDSIYTRIARFDLH